MKAQFASAVIVSACLTTRLLFLKSCAQPSFWTRNAVDQYTLLENVSTFKGRGQRQSDPCSKQQHVHKRRKQGLLSFCEVVDCSLPLIRHRQRGVLGSPPAKPNANLCAFPFKPNISFFHHIGRRQRLGGVEGSASGKLGPRDATVAVCMS